MGLGEGDSYGEILDIQTYAGRESRQEAALVGRHVGACLVIISYTHMEFLTWHEISCEDQVSEKIG